MNLPERKMFRGMEIISSMKKKKLSSDASLLAAVNSSIINLRRQALMN